MTRLLCQSLRKLSKKVIHQLVILIDSPEIALGLFSAILGSVAGMKTTKALKIFGFSWILPAMAATFYFDGGIETLQDDQRVRVSGA